MNPTLDVASRAPDLDEGGLMEAYRQIREAILRGTFPPGSRLSQVKISESLGLSRTPVREALRLIEKEGLVAASRGRQVVISPTSMRDLDELYALRIKLDCGTARATVPNLSDADIAEMQDCLELMSANEDPDHFDVFDRAHRQFHMIAIRGAGARHVDFSTRLNEHAGRYRKLYLAQATSYRQSKDEHTAIMQACVARSGERVAQLLAEHYARIALTIVAQIEPAFEPWLVRASLRAVVQDRTVPSRKDELERRVASGSRSQA